MNNVFVVMLGVWLWSVATGLREGYLWTLHRDRLPFLDYHAWRMVEQLGILLSVFGTGGLKPALIYLGLVWLYTFIVYEVYLDYMVKGEFMIFKKSNPYEIFGKTYDMNMYIQIAVTVIGFAMLTIGLKL